MKIKNCLVLLALPLAVSTAFAQETKSDFSFSGFGTAAVTHSNSDKAEFVRPNQESGSSKSYDFGIDSMLGLQGTYKFNDSFSTTAQVLVHKNDTDHFKGELAWAFLKYKASNDVSIRVGRIGLPIFMISDYRNIGYANTMLRPPVEMYAQVSIESVDGADVIYQHSFGDTTFTGQFAYGNSKPDLNSIKESKFSNISAFNLSLERGPFTIRAGRADATLDLDYPSAAMVGTLLKQYGFSNAANSVSFTDKKASFTSVGATMDWNNFLIQTEFGKRKAETLAIPSTTAWYTMFGYRYGQFLPYFNHAQSKQDSSKFVSGIPAIAALAPLQAGANSIASSGQEQISNSLGVRWDFNKSAAMKVQVDRISPKGEGTFAHVQPGFTGPVTVVAASVDFVF